MCYLANLPLTILDLRHCAELDNSGIMALRDLPLTHLFPWGGGCNRVGDLGVHWMRDMPLRQLDLRGCLGVTLGQISRCLEGKALELLDLGVLSRQRHPQIEFSTLNFPLKFLVLGGVEIDEGAVQRLMVLEPQLLYLDVKRCKGIKVPVRRKLESLMARKEGYVGPPKTLII